MGIPDRIQSIIDRYSLNAQRFAERIGVKTKQSVYDLLAGRTKSISKGMAQKILTAFPEINETWLLAGMGSMIVSGDSEETSVSKIQKVPLYSLDVVAGFRLNMETEQYIEGYIPWEKANEGDFAVHVTGDSMQPAIPNGANVLLREAPFGDMLDIDFGKVHAVSLDDDRTLLKKLMPDPTDTTRIVLVSFNPDYPPISVPITSVRHLYRAKSVRYNL